MSNMFRRLQEMGREDVVEGALRLMAEPLGYQVMPQDARPGGSSALHEMLEINRELGRLAEVVQQILEEGEITEEGQQAVAAQANRLIRQAVELKDAGKRGHEAQWTRGSLV